MTTQGQCGFALSRRQLLGSFGGFGALVLAAGQRSDTGRAADPTHAQRLAAFVANARYEDISDAARSELKARVLDSLACAIGAVHGAPIAMLRAQIEDFGGKPLATLIGGGKTAPDRAALFNGALVRYLDFNDSFLARGETCHPSDNLGAVLAASEYAGRSGRDFLTALAVAYEVQCRLSEAAPVRHKGFDHVTQGAYAAAAGVAKALGLNAEKTAHAIAISGTANNALRVTRTGALSHWKGLAYPHTGFAATHAAFLAMRGITGPLAVFEGEKGFMETIAGNFAVEWERGGLEAVRRTIIKKYNAEIHSQPAIEGILELREVHGVRGEQVDQIDVTVFDVAHQIIGGPEKFNVRTKEEADHSLPYMVAVALLDGDVAPSQYRPERIERPDVQTLLQKVVIRPDKDFSRQFPDQMPTRVHVRLQNGRSVTAEKREYEGFFTRPMPWDKIMAKFHRLASPVCESALRASIVMAVANIETIRVHDLTRLLSRVGKR